MILVYIIVISLLIKQLLYILECKLLFHPTKINDRDSFRSLPNNTSEYFITTSDNKKINLLYFRNQNTVNHIIYAHGNAGNIYNRLYIIKKLGKYASIVLFDYHGYGKSTGDPSEQALYIDINSVWDFLVKKHNINPKYITLYGESLGCSVVSWMGIKLSSSNNKPCAIIMQCGFSNLKNIVSDFYPKFITKILHNNFDNTKYIKTINNKIPILIAHSPDDEIINIYHKDLLIRSNPYAKFYKLYGPHSNHLIFDDTNYISAIRQYLYEK